RSTEAQGSRGARRLARRVRGGMRRLPRRREALHSIRRPKPARAGSAGAHARRVGERRALQRRAPAPNWCDPDPKKTKGNGMKLDTLAIHAGQHPEPTTGAVMTPVFQTSTYAQKEPGQAA